MSYIIPNVKLKHTKKPVLVMTDDTGKDLVDEIRRLRVALYAIHDDKPEEDISIKNLMEENESYKNDIEEYKDRIRELEYQNKEISDNIIKFLNELSDIFPSDRVSAIKTFEKAGFIHTGNGDQLLITKDLYFERR